jgi:hypothetical protein
MQPHLFVATPMYGGMCTGFYAQSLLQTPPVLNAAGVNFSYCAMFNESLIQRGRNALVAQFLKKPECTHLLWVDADIKFNPHDIVSLLRHDKDIIAGVYPKKEVNWQTVERAVRAGVPAQDLRNHTGSFVVNLVGGATEATVDLNTPIEVENAGTGFMLIKREVFENLEEHVNWYINDVLDLAGQQGPDKIYEYFPVVIQNSRLLSEDYAFCQIAKRHGYKIWVAPWVRLSHIGTYIFEGQPVPAA